MIVIYIIVIIIYRLKTFKVEVMSSMNTVDSFKNVLKKSVQAAGSLHRSSEKLTLPYVVDDLASRDDKLKTANENFSRKLALLCASTSKIWRGQGKNLSGVCQKFSEIIRERVLFTLHSGF